MSSKAEPETGSSQELGPALVTQWRPVSVYCLLPSSPSSHLQPPSHPTHTRCPHTSPGLPQPDPP